MFRNSKPQIDSTRVFDLCAEMLERANDVERVLSEVDIRTKTNAATLQDQDPDDQKDPTQKRAERLGRYYEEREILLRLQNDLLQLEMRLDTTAYKLRLLFRGYEPEALYELHFLGCFSSRIDAVNSDLADIDGPEATEASRDLGTNYMINKGKYPFGPIFTTAEILEFSKSVYQATTKIYRWATP